MANDSTLLYEELRDAAHDNDACLHHDVMNRAAARISELEKTLADERRAHATELAHVAMSERETDAARIADLERRLTDSDDAHGRTIEQRDLLEEWADELHTALGCDHEASNLHDYFACIRDNALTLQSHYESAERDGKTLIALRERVQATADVGCVNSPSGRRYPMKCYPKDKCSFCRARELLESL